VDLGEPVVLGDGIPGTDPDPCHGLFGRTAGFATRPDVRPVRELGGAIIFPRCDRQVLAGAKSARAWLLLNR
jgi:hypothetical protein